MRCDPSYYDYDDDQNFGKHGIFSKIPTKGMLAVVQCWREYGDPLWEYGYDEALSEEALQIFVGIDLAVAKAVKEFVKRLA